MPIDDTARVLLEQEMTRDPEQFRRRSSVDLGLPEGFEMTPLSPGLTGLAGGLADAASTYYFLKKGTGREDNALLGKTGNHPATTAAAALGGYGLSKLFVKVLKKFSPAAADAVESNLGAMQLGYAAGNVDDDVQSSSKQYQQMLMRNRTKGR